MDMAVCRAGAKPRKGGKIAVKDLNKLLNESYKSKNKTLDRIDNYELDKDLNIIQIIEKVKISDNANTGIYCFKDINELYLYANKVVSNNINFRGECFTSCIIDQMIQDNKIFKGIELNEKNVFNLGTPEQLNTYINNTCCFLFDLDGTLVISDDIYFNIWKIILKEYNIKLTDEIFKNYIQGNSDNCVIRNIIPSKYKDLLNDISTIKDRLFIQNIKKIKIIEGSIEFIKSIKQYFIFKLKSDSLRLQSSRYTYIVINHCSYYCRICNASLNYLIALFTLLKSSSLTAFCARFFASVIAL